MPELHKAKVLLLGDGAVGKTSLIRRFVVDQFGDGYITTIGTKVTKKEFQLLDGGVTKILAMTIWDVLGQHGYSSVQATALQGARAVLFVYDVSRPETLENLGSYWFPRLREVAGPVPAIVAGNKVDLAQSRKEAAGELERFAGRHGVPYFLTSAKTGEAVEDAFAKLGRACLGQVEAPFEALGGNPAAAEADPLVAATDRIMMDFCAEFGGVEAAMPIIKAQASRAGLDVKSPKTTAVRQFVENLAEVERGLKPAAKVAANHARRLQWIPRA